jgi:hypothetical protein
MLLDDKQELLIIQPWFTAVGHPAQSMLNTANVLGVNYRAAYLVSRGLGDHPFAKAEQQLRSYGHVDTFLVPSPSIRIGTFLSLLALFRLGVGGKFKRILFLDAHLVLLAFFWRWVAWLVKPERLSLIYLMGPEKISSHPAAKSAVKVFLTRPDTMLFLRTEELAVAWRSAFPEVPEAKIDVLPSLELTEVTGIPDQPVSASELKFGVLGQVRPGKGIEWLVPLFDRNPQVGTLTVAGAFSNQQNEQDLAVLHAHPNFINGFLAEDELVDLARYQHYLLMLYDNWDARMEAAILYLAAKVNRPVIVRDGGWCGRMVRAYNCGIVCEKGNETVDFFLALPKPGDDNYAALLVGLAKFRDAHSGAAWRQDFFDKIFGE